MFLGRDKKTEEIYQKEKKNLKLCPFCNPKENQNKIKKKYKYFLKIKNKYPYKGTTKHDLIVPKKHFVGIDELCKNKKAVWELFKILAEEEKNEQIVLFRTKKSADKSVKHFHIHLVKTKKQNGTDRPKKS